MNTEYGAAAAFPSSRTAGEHSRFVARRQIGKRRERRVRSLNRFGKNAATFSCHEVAMARLPRIVVSGCPHHVTARGNRREPIFFEVGDQDVYCDFLAEQMRKRWASFINRPRGRKLSSPRPLSTATRA